MSDLCWKCAELGKIRIVFTSLTSLTLGKEMSFYFIISVKTSGWGSGGVRSTEDHLGKVILFTVLFWNLFGFCN